MLGSVGEPINPAAWEWYYRVIGKERCPIVDTWWQTETGAIMISPMPGATPLKPGSAPFPCRESFRKSSTQRARRSETIAKDISSFGSRGRA